MRRGAQVLSTLVDSGNESDIEPMSKGSNKDILNQAIIEMLQEDGRRPFSEIANELGVSEGTIRNRVAGMKKAGLLRIVAIADPVTAEYKSDAMLGLKVAPGYTIETVSKRLAACADVIYILWVSGRYDLLVEIVSDDQNAYLQFLDEHIHSQADIASCETMSGLKNFKNQFLLKKNWS